MNENQRPQLPDAIARLLTRRPLILGTRQSPLAMAQARETAQRLRDAYHLPDDAITLLPVVASGDKVQDRALRDLGGKALWTRELDRALVDGEIDFAVHSMKDVETVRADTFHVAAMLPRADVRDVLLGADSIGAIPQGGVFGTSSPRRAAQMQSFRPDVKITLFRGNVATRMAKLAQGEADATLLAAAGLARLDMHGVGTPLEVDTWLPAASQGAIGLEALRANTDICRVLAGVACRETMQCVAAERAFLAALQGGCHSPVSALATHENGTITLRGELYSEDGSEKVAGSAEFATEDTESPAMLAAELLERAGPAITQFFGGA
ncbi:hydroxymethylbilane synthase [Sphingorhabdus sp. Alg239-R122]|uniref:hydroxymethylbilane synthase n=1 Tax=Sphingorhabdus sp. Alg239-R122 TaxID=2305989 RepID=UPI0013D919A5|nr:hydroxymethylbilane synthase [Sphingorhabdus sp. Alg239-R122]